LLKIQQTTFLIAAVLFAGSNVVAQAHAQQNSSAAAAAPTLSVTARIVVLDVVVTDKQGHIVPNLTAKDFTVSEDDAPQTVRYFEGQEQHALPPGVSIHSTADLAKAPDAPVTLLVLDELNTRFDDMAYARYTLEKYLNAQPAILTQPTALLVANNTKFNLIRDYTLDRQELLAALKQHFPSYPSRLMQSGKGGPGAAERLAMSLESLEQIAQATAGHPGRKNIVWVGPGFPAINTSESTDKEAAVIQQAVEHVIGMMRDSRITLSTIDPTIASSGTVLIQTPDDLDAAENENGHDPFAGDVNFQLLAPATGGRIYASRNDVDAEIGESILDGNNYYTLSYSPTNRNDVAQPYRRIHVKMNVPGLTATTRNGYYTQSSSPLAPTTPVQLNLDLKKMAADLGAAANSNLTYTGLTVTANRLPAAPDTLAVDVASKGLTFQDESDGSAHAEVTVMIASFNRQNKMIAHKIQEMTAQVKPGVTISQTATFSVPVQIPPGATRLRAIVRDTVSGKLGTCDLDLSAQGK
jgi:VWFA-related protein